MTTAFGNQALHLVLHLFSDCQFMFAFFPHFLQITSKITETLRLKSVITALPLPQLLP